MTMLLAADNLHALNPVVSEALRELNASPLQDLAVRCEQAGARWIDLNPGFLSPRYEDRMTFMVEAVQEVTTMGIVLDSPHARILAKGLEVCSKQPILNGLTLERHRIQEILPLAVRYKTQLVVLLLDENSVSPTRMEEKIALALQLRGLALEAGMAPDDLIFDPLLPNLSWHEAYFQISETIKTVRMLAGGAVFNEPARTIVGLSNLRSGLRKYYSSHLEQVCLGLLGGAELQFILADALDEELIQTWRLINQMSQSQGN